MHTKTMEGLVGARRNMDLVNTPMRIYREARRKGDAETMKRAMGYANEFSDKAEEYKAEADEGMKEDAREAGEKAEIQREEAVRRRREDREKLEKKMEESRNREADTDTGETSACLLEISEEGKGLLKSSMGLEAAVAAGAKPDTAGGSAASAKAGAAGGPAASAEADAAIELVVHTKIGAAGGFAASAKAGAARESAIYTKTGETVSAEQSIGTGISVSV